ncbi:D-glycero-beta-D-manno-heptose-1,7-bisphosphate 7-phosphatase [invertebrate metagenome]|uniref:D,D-heptose 1,7-bisphosphate phosphatase n=1 Tax=invertebrate metagenome TaxID=1711999 RepID=A0A2H9T8W6_9ZZZZ
MKKLLILDRDGVINEDSPHYIRSVEEWIPIPGSLEAIAMASQKGFIIGIATNQSGIGRGYFSRETLNAIHNKMIAAVRAKGGQIAAIKYCPHHPDDHCLCRKPLPTLLSILCKEKGIKPEHSWMVGDSLKDLQAGLAAGCKVALVKTGNGKKTQQQLSQNPELSCIPVFNSLSEFCSQLL